MNSRGQINDVSIAFGIIVFLTMVSVTFMYIGNEFGQPITDNNVPTSIQVGAELTGLGVFLQFFNYLLWGFGVIPFWLNAFILIPLKLILAFILIKNLTPFLGGG